MPKKRSLEFFYLAPIAVLFIAFNAVYAQTECQATSEIPVYRQAFDSSSGEFGKAVITPGQDIGDNGCTARIYFASHFSELPIVVTQVGGTGDDSFATYVYDRTQEYFDILVRPWRKVSSEAAVLSLSFMAIKPGRNTLNSELSVFAGEKTLANNWSVVQVDEGNLSDAQYILTQQTAPSVFPCSIRRNLEINSPTEFFRGDKIRLDCRPKNSVEKNIMYIAFNPPPAVRRPVRRAVPSNSSRGACSPFALTVLRGVVEINSKISSNLTENNLDEAEIIGFSMPQTLNGPDLVLSVLDNRPNEPVVLTLKEETYSDAETTHINESVFYVLLRICNPDENIFNSPLATPTPLATLTPTPTPTPINIFTVDGLELTTDRTHYLDLRPYLAREGIPEGTTYELINQFGVRLSVVNNYPRLDFDPCNFSDPFSSGILCLPFLTENGSPNQLRGIIKARHTDPQTGVIRTIDILPFTIAYPGRFSVTVPPTPGGSG